MYSTPPSTSTTLEQYASILKERLSDAYERVSRHVKHQQSHQKEYYDRGRRGDPYIVGDIVMLHEPAVRRGNSRKFHRPWKGPFKVVKVISSTVYRIQNCEHSRGRKVVHFNRLKPANNLSMPHKQDQAQTQVTNADSPISNWQHQEELMQDEYEFFTLQHEETSSEP